MEIPWRKLLLTTFVLLLAAGFLYQQTRPYEFPPEKTICLIERRSISSSAFDNLQQYVENIKSFKAPCILLNISDEAQKPTAGETKKDETLTKLRSFVSALYRESIPVYALMNIKSLSGEAYENALSFFRTYQNSSAVSAWFQGFILNFSELNQNTFTDDTGITLYTGVQNTFRALNDVFGGAIDFGIIMPYWFSTAMIPSENNPESISLMLNLSELVKEYENSLLIFANDTDPVQLQQEMAVVDGVKSSSKLFFLLKINSLNSKNTVRGACSEIFEYFPSTQNISGSMIDNFEQFEQLPNY